MRFKKSRLISLFIISTLFFIIFNCINVNACKDIVAIGDTTKGDYNLLLKVRDPSRPGFSVLFIADKGYEYEYHTPWTGKSIYYKTDLKFIGAATKGDTPPYVPKAGMAFSEAGIAYGDADSRSYLVNPTRYAWDDFDWIRYACQEATTEVEACDLLTKDVVDKMHAPGVAENLFVVGPKKAFVIEANSQKYIINEIEDIAVMSNYQQDLWRSSLLSKMFAPKFNSKFDGFVKEGRIVRLGFGSILGIRILDVGEGWITVRQVPFEMYGDKFSNQIRRGEIVRIEEQTSEKVGMFRVKLLECGGNQAFVTVTINYADWKNKMMEYIQSEKGSIDVKDMFFWSRLTHEDLEGLTAMSNEDVKYESAMVFKIPWKNYETISEAWFAANKPASSIYVPVHICDTEIYDPYETGEAAELALSILDNYGHDKLTYVFEKIEDVFINENDFIIKLSKNLIDEQRGVASLLTISDVEMQKQGYLTQRLWIDLTEIENTGQHEELKFLFENLWENNYSSTLESIKETVQNKNIERKMKDKLLEIGLSICNARLTEALYYTNEDLKLLEDSYKNAEKLLENEEYEAGFEHLEKTLMYSNMVLNDQFLNGEYKDENEINTPVFIYEYPIIILLIVIIIFLIALLIKNKVK